MFNTKWLLLQLFAGEGAGGDGGGEGAATGVNAADAGQKRLLELGVPAEKIRKNRAYTPRATAGQPPQTAETAPEQETGEKQAAAAEENPTEEKKADASRRMSWEEIMADPEYNRQMQETVRSRLKTAKASEEALAKLTPALEVLARKHGQDPSKIDYEALAKSISQDDSYYEDLALEMGVDVPTAKNLDQQKREIARDRQDLERMKQEQAQSLEQQKLRRHFDSLQQQGEELKKTFPGFNLMEELKNPVFARMTGPDSGLNVADVYYAVHRNEIQSAAMQVTAQMTAQKISNDIQAGSRRPAENGTSGQAPSVTTFDYRAASREQREALKKRILDEAAQGRKVYPGR